jgi:5-formyltetrahydrofolate cyclo-ligase
MPKRTLRQALLLRRGSLSDVERRLADSRALENLLARTEFAAAVSIAAYVPVRGETGTEKLLLSVLRERKRLLLPVVRGDRMIFREIGSLETLCPGSFGIPEPPESCPEREAGNADLVIVPGVAFDRLGRRVGYGKGYYDRFLHGLEGNGRFIGFCYDFQLLDEIAGEPHDVLMDWVITDRRVIGPLRRS